MDSIGIAVISPWIDHLHMITSYVRVSKVVRMAVLTDKGLTAVEGVSLEVTMIIAIQNCDKKMLEEAAHDEDRREEERTT